MRSACGNGDKVSAPRRRRLTKPIGSPSDETAIGPEGKAMPIACGNGNKVSAPRRRRLTYVIASPADNFFGTTGRHWQNSCHRKYDGHKNSNCDCSVFHFPILSRIRLSDRASDDGALAAQISPSFAVHSSLLIQRNVFT
jgi:hypothetical protein